MNLVLIISGLDCWLDRTSIVSLWALGRIIMMAFLTIFIIFTSQTSNLLIEKNNIVRGYIPSDRVTLVKTKLK